MRLVRRLVSHDYLVGTGLLVVGAGLARGDLLAVGHQVVYFKE